MNDYDRELIIKILRQLLVLVDDKDKNQEHIRDLIQRLEDARYEN